MVFKLSWLPYMLIIGGVFALFSGEESTLGGIVMIAIGAIWLYLKHSNKNENSNVGENKSIDHSPTETSIKPEILKCKKCGAELDENAVYCVNCGSKVS